MSASPKVGDVVTFTNLDGRERPAIIVRTWGGANGSANLVIFADGWNDAEHSLLALNSPRDLDAETPPKPGVHPVLCYWETSVERGAPGKPRSWY